MDKKKKADTPKNENLLLAGYAGALVAVFGLAGANLYGFADGDEAKDILENDAKLQNVEITGKANLWDCRGSILFRTAFTAESNGEKVEGVLCDTIFKPASVRFSKTPPTKPSA